MAFEDMFETEQDPPTFEGELVTRYESSVFCGLCGNCDTLFNDNQRRQAIELAREARQRGWRLTRSDGWICPDKH